MRILIAEDEKALARALVKILEKNNYSADAVFDGEEALNYLENGNYDAAILDVMMPKMNGLLVLRKLRAKNNTIPVIMLTAKSEIEDRVIGLDAGANDYLPKPFDTRELLARVRAITRNKSENEVKLTFGNLTLNRATFELSTNSGVFRLSNKEYQIMEYLMLNPHVVFSTEKFMEKIWGFDCDAEINVVWVYISYLRKKLTALNANVFIKASRGVGYSLEEGNDS